MTNGTGTCGKRQGSWRRYSPRLASLQTLAARSFRLAERRRQARVTAMEAQLRIIERSVLDEHFQKLPAFLHELVLNLFLEACPLCHDGGGRCCVQLT